MFGLTVTFSGWLIPAAITLIYLILAWRVLTGPSGWGDIMVPFYLVGGLIAPLIAWLIYFIIV